MLENEQKVPYRRLEPAVLKFAKIVIPTDLERLRNHQLNIEKYRRCRSWDRLHKEHINAGRTVQQLRANVQEMETLLLKVKKEDTHFLTTVLQPVKELASASIKDFLELHSKSVEDLNLHEERFYDKQITVKGKESFCEKDSNTQVDSQFLEIQEQYALESWNDIEKDLLDLDEIVNDFSHLVHALKYKLSVLPAAGALIGGIVGGPIGLMAGFKVAGIAAAIGGGLLGFTGGKILQRKKEIVAKEQVSIIEDCPQEDTKST
ncbi:syntaxin-17 isoform X2 [Mixophyes fleayi]|uniref:syntaxin-17 isoform X2 n=1 Tax=Mixophyes fleayi TaxID=3061075 RepID=UPI003F4DA701